MPFQVIPPKQTGLGAFTEAFTPAFERGLERGEKRKERAADVALKEATLKQAAITNAYKAAESAAARYADQNPADEDLFINAQVEAARVFDNFMEQAGYPDVDYLTVTGDVEVEEKKVEKKPSLLERVVPGLGAETRLPKEAPVSQKVGEKIAQVGGGVLGEVGKLPSRAMGSLGTLYNVLGGVQTGLTGTQPTPIPPHILNMMTRGDLFNIQQASQFYKEPLQKSKEAIASRTPPYIKDIPQQIKNLLYGQQVTPEILAQMGKPTKYPSGDEPEIPALDYKKLMQGIRTKYGF